MLTRPPDLRLPVIGVVPATRSSLRLIGPRVDLVDHEGLDPARSLRPSGLESLMLATACHLLPAEMREIGRAGVPQMWAWPTSSWIDIQDRATELTIAAAMAQAVIELHDRAETRRGRTSTLAIIDGQAPSR